MRKLLQSLKTGEINLIDVPTPSVPAKHVLIETRKTLISAGTERMLLNFGKGNLVQKAMQQPDKVKQTLTKVKTDGLGATLEAVRSKLDQPIPLGYCNAGIVRAVGRGVTGFKIGDRVVSNGPHSELVVVGQNLVARIPDSVTDEEAAFTPLAAIALQGLRLAKPTLGETFCVMGLGLVGLMSAQFLMANGCKVIGTDFSKERLALAESWGVTTVDLGAGGDAVATALSATDGHGVDGVIIAAATDSNDPIEQAAKMSRKRGRIVLVGVSGLNLSRDDFFEKELSFQVSCSYGPGRYDSSYEDRGEDYPFGFVRWTQQRNFQAVLDTMARKTLDVRPLISKTIAFSDAPDAYAALDDKGADNLGLLMDYPDGIVDLGLKTISLNPVPPSPPSSAVIALIGAGNFGGRVTAPGLKSAGARLKTIVSRGGVSGAVEGKKAGFEETTTEFETVLEDMEIDSVVIATRHDTHGWMTEKAIRAGKNVFVEKPLGITNEEIDSIEAALSSHEAEQPRLMIGFNRRFSPYSIKMKSLLDTISEPKCLIATINAGALPAKHWAHDPVQGGGRIIGEGCHFIDLLRFFVGAPITDMSVTQIAKPTQDGIKNDKVTLTFTFEDGSIGTLHYFANGPKALIKERYEAFAGERHLQLDNFQQLTATGWGKGANLKGKQDKGHAAALDAFVKSVQSGSPAPIPLNEVLEVSRWSIRAGEALI